MVIDTINDCSIGLGRGYLNQYPVFGGKCRVLKSLR